MIKWFNPNWWIYYWRADTLFQVHSPFLFDFADRVLSARYNLSGDVKQSNTEQLSLKTKSCFPQWIFRLWKHYGVEIILLDENEGRSLPLEKERFLIPEIHKENEPKSIRKYSLTNERDSDDVFQGKNTFPHFWLYSIDRVNDLKMKPTTPTIVILEGIHWNQQNYHRWKEIIKRPEFDFSIELYNFGVLFHHPVNTLPEHITLIPWRKKPWKFN